MPIFELICLFILSFKGSLYVLDIVPHQMYDLQVFSLIPVVVFSLSFFPSFSNIYLAVLGLSYGIQDLSLQQAVSLVVGMVCRLSCPTACGILVPQPGLKNKTPPPPIARQILNHWTASGSPPFNFLNGNFYCIKV